MDINLGLRSVFVNDFVIEGYPVEILHRPYQRTMKLRVRTNGTLRVTCARSVKIDVIRDFVARNLNFVEKNLAEIAELRRKYPRLEYLSGEHVLVLGQKLPLEVIWCWDKKPNVSFFEDQVELKIAVSASREDRQRALARAYEKHARQFLTERMAHWSSVMKLRVKRLSFRSQRTRWGSCSPDGSISLNWKLLGAPWDVIDYVLIHELAHIPQPNHSPAFWRIVEKFCPRYRDLRDWLRENQYEFEFLEAKSELHAG